MIYFGENLRAVTTQPPNNVWCLERKITDAKSKFNGERWESIGLSPYFSTILATASSYAAKAADHGAHHQVTTLQTFWDAWVENSRRIYAPFIQVLNIAWVAVERDWSAILEGAPNPRAITRENLVQIKLQFKDDTEVQALVAKVEHLLEMQTLCNLADVAAIIKKHHEESQKRFVNEAMAQEVIETMDREEI